MPIDPFSPAMAADPKHWRDKAEEARILAERMHDPEAIEIMLRAAVEFERLANMAEGLHRTMFAAHAKFFRADD